MQEFIQKPKCYNGNENYVFVSYSHKNQDVVWEDIASMQKNGYRVWFDDGLHVGDSWKDRIFSKIKSSACGGIIVYLSEDSFYSEGLMNDLKWAERYSKRILSVIIDCRLPDEIFDSIVDIMNESQCSTATAILRYFPPDVISLFRMIADEEYYQKLFDVLDVLNVKKQEVTDSPVISENFESKRAFVAANAPCVNFTREFSFFTKIDSSFSCVLTSAQYLTEGQTCILGGLSRQIFDV